MVPMVYRLTPVRMAMQWYLPSSALVTSEKYSLPFCDMNWYVWYLGLTKVLVFSLNQLYFTAVRYAKYVIDRYVCYSGLTSMLVK